MKYAVIDIGSNSVKMSLAEIEQESYRIIDIWKEPLRLLRPGESQVHEEDIELLLQALLGFKRQMDTYQCPYRIMATSALREARNKLDVLARVKQRLDMHIEVITGEQEAALVGGAHQHLFATDRGHHLIFDIGGGSFECIEIKKGRLQGHTSLPLGTLKIQNMFAGMEAKRKQIEQVTQKITTRLSAQNIACAGKKTRVYICGGNPSAVAKMNLRYHQIHYDLLHKQHIYKSELASLLQQIRKKKVESIASQYEIKSHRADLVVPTLVLIIALLDFIQADDYTVSKTGISEGEIIRKMLSGAM